MKKLLLAAQCLVAGFVGSAQNNELPPVNLPSGTQICESPDWKLVLYDDFDGTTLKAPWNTFYSYPGMYNDHQNWAQGRIQSPFNAVFKAENVVVSDGTVKLKAKRENASWDTATGLTVNTQYTSAVLTLPFQINGVNRGFHSGKFAARMKLPTFKWAHSTMWTWYGTRVNEIDMVEAYGHGQYADFWGDYPHANWSLHAWAPKPSENINNMNNYENGPHHYPWSTWWDWLTGNLFKIDDYHTYVCEWDTAKIHLKVDSYDIGDMWKYYQVKSYHKWWNPFTTYYYCVGSGCNPDAGTWRITPGFPYEKNSNSQFHLELKIDKKYSGSYETSHPSGYLGQMEIDWVKIWQRRPKESNWTDLNAGPDITIQGPDIVCAGTNVTYTVDHPTPNGSWMVLNGQILSSNNTSAVVKYVFHPKWTLGAIYYHPNDPIQYPSEDGVTDFAAIKKFDNGTASESKIICSKTVIAANNTVQFNLTAMGKIHLTADMAVPYNSPTTCEWFVHYGEGLSSYYHGFGQSISTPPVTYNPGATTSVSWTVLITNGCGLHGMSGAMNYLLFRKSPPRDTTGKNDTTALYVGANITDIDAYNGAVRSRLASTFIDARDSIEVGSAIERIELEELAPYLVLDSAESRGFDGDDERRLHIELSSATQIYPNPASTMLSIVLNNKYDDAIPATITLYDNLGRAVLTRPVENVRGINQVDVSSVPAGLYNLTVQQGNRTEHFRTLIQKQ